MPDSTDEVAEVLRAATTCAVRWSPGGPGRPCTAVANAPDCALSPHLSGINRVLALRTEKRAMEADPGLRRLQLDVQLRDTGLDFPIHPGAEVSLGGRASTRASGTAALRSGRMTENVSGQMAVLADRRVIRTGGALRWVRRA